MSSVLGRLVEGLIAGILAPSWIWTLAPWVYSRWRGDPRPSFPELPLAPRPGSDGAAFADSLRQGIQQVLPGVAFKAGQEPLEVDLTSPILGSGECVVISWDSPSPGGDTIYVSFIGFAGEDLFYECETGGGYEEAFWVAVGFLRSGAQRRDGRAWIFVPEVGLWRVVGDTVPLGR